MNLIRNILIKCLYMSSTFKIGFFCNSFFLMFSATAINKNVTDTISVNVVLIFRTEALPRIQRDLIIS